MIRTSAIAGGLSRIDKPTTNIVSTASKRVTNLDDKGGFSVPTQPSDFIFDTIKQIAQKKQAIIQAKIDADNKAKADALAAEQEAQQVTNQANSQSYTVIPPVYTHPATMPTGSHTDLMAAAGINPADYSYVEYIIQNESQWNPCAYNPGQSNCGYTGNTACGLVQAFPCDKLRQACGDWTNAICALQWANTYVLGTYGSWAAVYAKNYPVYVGY